MAKAAVELNITIDYLINRFEGQNDTLIIVTADHETGGLKVSPDKDLKNIHSEGNISFSYEYTSNSHTKTFVPVYLNKDVFNFTYLDENTICPTIKNIQIARGLKKALIKQ